MIKPGTHVSKKNRSLSSMYRVVTLISLNSEFSISNFIDKLTSEKSEEIFSNVNGRVYDIHKNKQRIMFMSDENFSDHELLFACRSSDIVVFLVSDSTSILEKKIAIAKRHLPTFAICSLESSKSQIKKYVSTTFGDSKIISPENLLNYLCECKYNSSNVSTRPRFVPFLYEATKTHIFYTGLMHKRFLSFDFICNGLHFIESESIKFEDGRVFTKENLNQNTTGLFEIKSIEQPANENTSNDLSSISEDDNISDSVEYVTDTFNKIHDYENSHQPIPDYYQGLIFYKNESSIPRKISKINNDLTENCIVTLKIPIHYDISSKGPVFFYNVLPTEMSPTIFNFNFNAKTTLKSYEPLLIDFGNVIFEINPIFYSNNLKESGYVIQSEAESMNMCFIAPRIYTNYRCDIYKSVNSELKIENLVGSCSFLKFENTSILKETIIRGIPRRIDKRYCTVHKMFGSKEEVLFFRNFKIWTKTGNSGIVKKPIGVRGVFKAYFNIPVNHSQKICMSLLNREYLRNFEFNNIT